MPIVPKTRPRQGTMPGTARNMPMIAVKTISATTRGLVSSRYWLTTGSMSHAFTSQSAGSGNPAAALPRASLNSYVLFSDRLQTNQQRDQGREQYRRAAVVRG